MTSLLAQNRASEDQSPDSATIILYRPKGLGASLMKVKIEVGPYQARLRNGSVEQMKVPAGTYEVTNATAMFLTRKQPWKLEARAGEIYYIRYRWCYQLFYAVDDLIEVSPDFALGEMKRRKVLRKDARTAE